MNILFIEETPSQELSDLLKIAGIEVETVSAAQKFPAAHPTIVVWKAQDLATGAKYLARLNKKYPKSTIAAVIPGKWLNDPALYRDLFGLNIHRVIIEEYKVPMIWLLLKEKLTSKSQTKQKEIYEELAALSQNLVTHMQMNLDLASSIQHALLPKNMPQMPGLHVSSKFVAAPLGGGDYFDVIPFEDKKQIGILMADSESHGMAAALLGILLKVQMQELKTKYTTPAQFMEHLVRELKPQADKLKKNTHLLYGVLDRPSLEFRYATSGDLLPLHWRAGKFLNLEKGSTLHLSPGDALILFSNGLDRLAKRNARTASELIQETLSGPSLLPDASDARNNLMGWIDRHLESHPLEDDITWIQISIDPHTLYVQKAQ